MLKKLSPLFIAAVVCMTGAACSKPKTAAQLHAEKEKAWREEQRVKAARYYQELVDKFGDTPYAGQARERLQVIGPVAPQKGGAKPVGGPAATARK